MDFQFLHNLTCALEEGCLSPSAYESVGGDSRSNLRKLLRFTQKISNIGNADFISPHHPDDWQWHSCHKHFHRSRFSMFTGRWRRHRGDKRITGYKYECIFKVRTYFWSSSWIAYRCIQVEIEIFLNSIGDQPLIIIKQIINPHKVIRRVFVSKTPNACRDGGKSTTARLNKQ